MVGLFCYLPNKWDPAHTNLTYTFRCELDTYSGYACVGEANAPLTSYAPLLAASLCQRFLFRIAFPVII